MNPVFGALFVIGLLTAVWTERVPMLSEALARGASQAIEVTLGLTGQLALWLGLVAILREAGAVAELGRRLRPALRRLFPQAGEEALGPLVLSISANVFAMGNAATPFGLKAMRALDASGAEGRAFAMQRFVVIICSGVAVIPTEMVGLRAAEGSAAPGAIILPTIGATFFSTVVGLLVLGRGPQADGAAAPPEEKGPFHTPPTNPLRLGVALASSLLLVAGVVLHPPELRGLNDHWILPGLVLLIVAIGWWRRVRLYEVFVKGAREGLEVALMVAPYLVAILVALAWFRASGALDGVVETLRPLVELGAFPAEALPMALVRPLSGSGAMGVAADVVRIHGPDSFVGTLVTVMNGSTETTFYVLALYYGVTELRPPGRLLLACLMADFAGVVAAHTLTLTLLF
jgi:spore maturation protein SpmB